MDQIETKGIAANLFNPEFVNLKLSSHFTVANHKSILPLNSCSNSRAAFPLLAQVRRIPSDGSLFRRPPDLPSRFCLMQTTRFVQICSSKGSSMQLESATTQRGRREGSIHASKFTLQATFSRETVASTHCGAEVIVDVGRAWECCERAFTP
jgi:hypothetical protein